MNLAETSPPPTQAQAAVPGIADSLGLRLAAATSLCLLLIFAGILYRDVTLIEKALSEPFRLRVESLKPVLNAALSDPIVKGDFAELLDRLSEAQSDDDIAYLVVRDANDRVVAAAGRDPAAPLPLASAAVLDPGGVYHAYMLIESDGKKRGTLNFGLSTRRLASYRDEVLSQGFAMLVLRIVIVGALQAWVAIRITRRLRSLTEASESVALGRYDLVLNEQGSDEVARLAASLNSMRRAVSERIHLLEASEIRFRGLTDFFASFVWELDEALRFTMVRGRGLEELGLKESEMLGRTTQDLAAGGRVVPLNMTWDEYEALRAKRLPYRDVRASFRLASGEVRYLSLWGEPVFDPDGRFRGYRGITQDITERERLERQIQHLNESLERRVEERTAELQAANRELESFSYSVSHDLRAPLRAINGFSGILRQRHADTLPADSAAYLLRIGEAARTMGELVDGLLRLSQTNRATLVIEHVDMRGLVEDVLLEIGDGTFPQAVRIVGDLPPPRGDRALLRQVWRNLIDNALKFSRKAPQPQVEISGRPVDGGVTYSIRDNGAGFDPAHAGKLFGVFERMHTTEEFEGTGIGLAIVQRVVVRHGGRVWAESEQGRGATFAFTIGR